MGGRPGKYKQSCCLEPRCSWDAINPFTATSVRDLLCDGWDIEQPHDYQLDAIFQIAYCKIEMMYIIRKCGEGKSPILYGVATVLSGITI